MVKAKPALLLVEDDADMADMYALQLKSAGYKVFMAGSAQAALDSLDIHKVAAVILDILLPEYNGLGVLHELRSYEDWRRLPVIILSSVTERELGLNQALKTQLGIAACLDKAHTNQHDLVRAVSKLKI